MNIYGEYFYGNKISDYGLENGYVDYSTLAKAFDAVLNNEIIEKTYDIGYWEQVSGMIDNADEIEDLEEKKRILEDKKYDLENEDGTCAEIFQYYIVDDSGAALLQEINEIVFYNETLDMHVWGVTHYGTAWSYVLTDIPCNTGKF